MRLSTSRKEVADQITNLLTKVAAWDIEGRDSIYSDYVLFRFVDLKLLLKPIELILKLKTHQKTDEFRVLDIGTSLGVVPLTLKHFGVTAYACDHPRERRFGLWLEKEGVAYVSFDLSQGDLPYQDEFFDVVILKDVIEHLPFSPKRTLEAIHRILKPKGLLMLITPNVARLSSRIRLLLGRSIHPPVRSFYDSEFPFHGHYREYSCDELKRMLSWSRFEVVTANFLQQSDVLFLLNQRKSFSNNRFQKITWKQIIALLAWKPLTLLAPSLAQMIFVVARKSEIRVEDAVHRTHLETQGLRI